MEYVTGTTIKKLREKQNLTQKELADKLMVSDKAVSKWETNRGLPDLCVIEDLAKALGVSLSELLTGDLRINENISANMKKMQFYVCPICGNVINSMGDGCFTCCGINLPKLESEAPDSEHQICVEQAENELLITMAHSMSKNHYISFVAYISSDTLEIKKLYPEQDVCVRFKRKGHGMLYAYCNKHGMFKLTI
ncbi:MAG: helix-turn-helix domain-containing protein [Monoglobaceae bacterium]